MGIYSLSEFLSGDSLAELLVFFQAVHLACLVRFRGTTSELMRGLVNEMPFGKKKRQQKFRKPHKNQHVDSNHPVCTVDQVMLKIHKSELDFRGSDLEAKWARKGGIVT